MSIAQYHFFTISSVLSKPERQHRWYGPVNRNCSINNGIQLYHENNISRQSCELRETVVDKTRWCDTTESWNRVKSPDPWPDPTQIRWQSHSVTCDRETRFQLRNDLPALVQGLKAMRDIVEVGSRVRRLGPALLHDLDVLGRSRPGRHGRTTQRRRLAHLLDYLCRNTNIRHDNAANLQLREIQRDSFVD